MEEGMEQCELELDKQGLPDSESNATKFTTVRTTSVEFLQPLAQSDNGNSNLGVNGDKSEDCVEMTSWPAKKAGRIAIESDSDLSEFQCVVNEKEIMRFEADATPIILNVEEDNGDDEEMSVLSFGDDSRSDHNSSPKLVRRPSTFSSEDDVPVNEMGKTNERNPAWAASSDAESLMSLGRGYRLDQSSSVKEPTLVDTSDFSNSSHGVKCKSGKDQMDLNRQKIVKRLSKKQRDNAMKEIKSKTERMKREAPLKLPYHKPEIPSLNEFLDRRNRSKAEFKISLGSKFKLQGVGGLGNKLENNLFKFQIDEVVLQKKGDNSTIDLCKNDEDPMDKIEIQIPFSVKVDEWMKTFESEEMQSQIEQPVDIQMDIITDVAHGISATRNLDEEDLSQQEQDDNSAGNEKGLSSEVENIKLSDNQSDDDDCVLIIDENMEMIPLAQCPNLRETQTEKGEENLNNITPDVELVLEAAIETVHHEPGHLSKQVPDSLQAGLPEPATFDPKINVPNRFQIVDVQLDESSKVCEKTALKTTPPRKTIADLLRSLPNHDKLLQLKPEIRNDFVNGFVDLSTRPKKSSQQQRKMQALMDRFVKHTAVQKKPKEQHFTVHVLKKEEDSQGQQNITVNEVDYVQHATTEVDETNGNGTTSPSPNHQAPGARLTKLRECLRAQIHEKKKVEYAEKLKRYAIDNEENPLEEGKIEDDEEDIIEDEDMTETESEPEVTDEEELENIRLKGKKNQKKRCVFLEDEAEDDEDEENNEGDDDEDEESDDETGDDDGSADVSEIDLISIKSSNLPGGKVGRKLKRVIQLSDSSDNEEGLPDVEDKLSVETGNDKPAENEVKENENENVDTFNTNDALLDTSQDDVLDIPKVLGKKFSTTSSLNSNNSGSFGVELPLKPGANGLAQDMLTETALNANDTNSFSPTLSIDNCMPSNWRTPRRTPSEIEKLFSLQVTPGVLSLRCSGQVDSQRPETPRHEFWATPKSIGESRTRYRPNGYGDLSKSPFMSQTPPLMKVNSELALDYFLQDNLPSSTTTPNSLPKEITRLFESGSGLPLPGLSYVRTTSKADDDELMALCSGNFPTQPQPSPEESQQPFQESDEDEDVYKSLLPLKEVNFTVTPKNVNQRFRFQSENETPKMSEKTVKTTRLFVDEEDKNKSEVDDDDNESHLDFKIVRRRKRRLEISDEELDDLEVDTKVESKKESEYDDNEENEIIIRKPAFKGIVSRKTGLIRKEFVEAEAELSGSEFGSGDEDERGLDYLDEEECDAEKIDEEALRDEVGKAHFKQMLDDDQRQVRLLQEAYLEHGDLHTDGKTRERQFKWKNIDDVVNDDAHLGYEDKDEVIDEAEIERQKEKIEKVKWMKENSHLIESDDDEEEDISQNFLENTQFLKIRKSTFAKIQSSFLKSDNSMSIPTPSSLRVNTKISSVTNLNKTDLPLDEDAEHNITSLEFRTTSQQFFPSVEDPFIKIRKGSFLSRGSPTLSRLAEMTKINDSISNVKNNSRNFVFAVVTPPAPSNSEGNHVKSNKLAARRPPVQPKKVMKIDRSFSSMDCTSKEASIFKWFK